MISARAEKSTSWRASTQYLGRLVNREGYVPVKARLSREDLSFLAGAREDLAAFADLGLRLMDLHQPKDGGGLSSDPEHPIHRCRSCMNRWPCATYKALSDAFG
jgi:hypothetical protein